MVLHEKRRPEAESGTHQASSACNHGVSLVRIYRLLIYKQLGTVLTWTKWAARCDNGRKQVTRSSELVIAWPVLIRCAGEGAGVLTAVGLRVAWGRSDQTLVTSPGLRTTMYTFMIESSFSCWLVVCRFGRFLVVGVEWLPGIKHDFDNLSVTLESFS